MADGIYLGMAGAAARSTQVDAISDALANAQSPGYKAERPAFQSFLAKASTKGGPQPSYPAAVETRVDLRAGSSSATGNPLDVIPEDDAFLAVQRPGGEVLYTRDGRIRVDAEGRLLAGGGRLLNPQGQPISVPPGTQPDLTKSGQVMVGGIEVDRVGTFKLAGNIQRAGEALYAPQAALPAPDAGLRIGELEMSNFSPLEATVQLVSAQRGFEHGMQAIETYRRMADRSNEIGKVK